MSIWVLSDPHLAFGVPSKTMESFGPTWKHYAEKMAHHWKEKVSLEDLVLIPGDISWAMYLAEALVDLRWIDALPGKKLILKGNHDHWKHFLAAGSPGRPGASTEGPCGSWLRCRCRYRAGADNGVRCSGGGSPPARGRWPKVRGRRCLLRRDRDR